MSKLCVSTVVSGDKYSHFIPFYIYSILTCGEPYYPLICHQGPLPDAVCNSLDKLRHLGAFEVRENMFSDYSRDPCTVKTLRWLFYLEEFECFDYVYIGDIDIFIVEETPSLLEQSIENCRILGLPYSNVIRPNSQRLSGLHFVARDTYYKGMLPVINKYKEQKKFSGVRNEHFLYDLVKQSPFGLPPKNATHRPHHGLHLRAFDPGRDMCWLFGRKDYEQYYRSFRKVYNDPLFHDLINNTTPYIKKEFDQIKKCFLCRGVQ